MDTVHVYNDDKRAQVLSVMGYMEDVVSPVHHLSIGMPSLRGQDLALEFIHEWLRAPRSNLD
jgi:hypothetical protein